MDPRTKPRPGQLSLNVNKKKMITDWKESMDHFAEIRTCATCGREQVMTEGEYHLLDFASPLLNCCKADINRLHAKNSLKYDALHLVTLNKEIFKLSERGVDYASKKVTVCKTCRVKLKYAQRVQKAPILGKIMI